MIKEPKHLVYPVLKDEIVDIWRLFFSTYVTLMEEQKNYPCVSMEAVAELSITYTVLEFCCCARKQ